MIGKHFTRAAFVIAATVAAGGAIAVLEASAQSGKAAAPKAKAPAEVWHDCNKATDAANQDAIAKATELLGRLWLPTERGQFAAYTMAGEKRNPFDLSPKEPDSGPRDGIVQARPPKCTWRTDEASAAIVVRFMTPFYRFHETGPGWSPPLRNGLMLEAAMTRAGESWLARDTSGEQGILLPEQKPRAAQANALPPDIAWAEPIPGCARRTKWNGEACVSRKK